MESENVTKIQTICSQLFILLLHLLFSPALPAWAVFPHPSSSSSSYTPFSSLLFWTLHTLLQPPPLHFTLVAADCSVESKSERRETQREAGKEMQGESEEYAEGGGGIWRREKKRNEGVVTGLVCVWSELVSSPCSSVCISPETGPSAGICVCVLNSPCGQVCV